VKVESEKDFKQLRQFTKKLYKRFPMFRHDVLKIENIIEEHIKQYSIAMVHHRQSHSKTYLETAEQHIKEINRVLSTVEKIELLAILSRS
jgi:hypothetical protein